VFLDESGVNLDMVRRYGRSVGKSRVVDRVPLNTPKATTLISSIRLNGQLVHKEVEGSINGERFQEYLRDCISSQLHAGDMVVMDNLGSHKMAEVARIIEQAGATVMYLPAYSPDLNPIEKMWSKIKAFIRKLRPSTKTQLDDAISSAFKQVTPSDCLGWFSSAGIPLI